MRNFERSLEMLFVSKVRIKALSYFLLNPDEPIHLRGAVRELDEEINAVRRELLRLEEMNLLVSEQQGNRKYFKLNIQHEYIDELLSIFHKSSGLGAEIINSKNLGDISFAALTESFTKGTKLTEQVIDLAIVGFVDMNELNKIIKSFEEKSKKELHYTVMKPSEFQIRKRRRDDFIYNLLIQQPIMLIGNHQDFIS